MSTVAHNKFSDWSAEEKKRLAGVPETSPIEAQHYSILKNTIILPTDNLPESVDWVKSGAVNAIQDQGNCGSCWAFSAIATMEGAHQIKTGELQKLSEQQCVDCDSDSMGCKGGWPDNCMWYTYDNNGINSAQKIPYKAASDTCLEPFGGPVSVTAVNHVKQNDQGQLMAAVAKGPVSVIIASGAPAFLSYEGGIITKDSCDMGPKTMLDHAVVVVGYGHCEKTGLDYWMIRNSWGAAWGGNGYAKFERQGDGIGTCGLMSIMYYPSTN